MQTAREKWIDDIKLAACILVALGHFFQSMTASQILPAGGFLDWFDKTIYYFHVPLFFLCSGWLYQRKAGRDRPWKHHVLEKALVLGVPYAVFSAATWLLKEVFSGSVNSRNLGLVQTLLLEPASPYWYLYTLFFVFVLTPRFRDRKTAAAVAGCAAVLKGLRILWPAEIPVFAVWSVMEYGIWFVLGMLLQFLTAGSLPAGKGIRKAGAVSFAAFLAVSLWLWAADVSRGGISFLMGLWACGSLILTVRSADPGKRLRRVLDVLAGYTMPVFLMHTIFAAGVRAVLLKLGIDSGLIHIAAGIAASFAGPIVAAEILQRLKLDFLLYPGKYLFKRKPKEMQHG